MSMGVPNAFALLVNFIGANWEPKHVTIDLFETTKTIMQTISLKHQALLDKYDVKKQSLPSVKKEVLIQ
jgi:DNA-directed RNA polymerase subunit H (RpoH/RPB5)